MTLLRPKELLKPVKLRFMLIPHAIIGFTVSYGAAFDRISFTSPIYGAIFEWISLTVVGIAFTITTILALYAMASASWKAYYLTNVITFGLSLLWLVSLLMARFEYGYSVSTVGLGLWGFILATCILLASSPTSVVVTR